MKRVFAALSAIMLLMSGCGSSDIPSAQKNINKNTSTSDNGELYIMAGKIKSNSEVNVSSKISAKVSKIMVDLGSKVTKGQPLIYLDTQDIAAQVSQAAAGASAAQANLNKALDGARPEQVAQAKASLESAKTNFITVKNNLQRTKQLYQQGGVSIQQLETAQAQYASADAALKSAQEALNILTRGETKDTIDMLRSQANQAKAALDYAKALYSNSAIVSPIDGTVSKKNINVGELATPGMQLLSIVGSNTVYVEAQVPTEFVDQVKVGQPVVVKVRELSDKKLSGKISVVSPVVDTTTKNVTVKVEIDDDQQILKPGMIAEIGIKK